MSSHLVKACCKQVEGGQDAAIWAQAVLLHDIFVVDLQGMHNLLSCSP